jgi:hypothetical protein
MNNSTITTKISAAFLATVLVAGIIAVISPSFMMGAQAQEYGMEDRYSNQEESDYGMDSYKKKSNAKDVSVKNVKCNNINVNVNGLELNTTSVPFLSKLLKSEAHGDEGERGASSYGSGGSYGSSGSYGDKRSGSDGDFKFVCINNNNNTVSVVTPTPTPTPTTPVEDECEECFDNLTVDLKRILADALRDGFTIGPLVIDAGSSIADLCDELREVGPIELTAGQIIGFIFEERIFQEADIFSLIELLLCLQNLDLVDIDLFSIFSTLQERGLISQDATVPATP